MSVMSKISSTETKKNEEKQKEKEAPVQGKKDRILILKEEGWKRITVPGAIFC